MILRWPGLSSAHHPLTHLLGKQLHLGCAGTVARRSRVDDEIQPAQVTNSGAAVAGPASAAGNQPAPRRVVQETDDGKARFVCCGFGGRKAGSRGKKDTQAKPSQA